MERCVVIMVGTQMAENVGSAARAMANFGIHELRLVQPKCDHLHEKARALACRGQFVLERHTTVYQDFSDAIRDCERLYAVTVRPRAMEKDVMTPEALCLESIHPEALVGLLFGCEKDGLENAHLRYADKILTIPTHEPCLSMNVAQAVSLVCYAVDLRRRFCQTSCSARKQVPKKELMYFVESLLARLEEKGFFETKHMEKEMQKNIYAMFARAGWTRQEVQTLHGVVKALSREAREA